MRPRARFLKDFVKQEVPSGTINGSNAVFTVSQTIDENESLKVYLNGVFQKQGTHYTVSGTTITFSIAPALGQELDCVYHSKDGE